MKSTEIRSKFLNYFEARGHAVVRSSPLVPGNDPTMLLTNSGMVQFKDVFLGEDTRPYTRATTVQRCVRAGGKHNDLENVGYTARHHTFFEMLGNFSFGDYFKRDAIQFAWELLTKVYGLPAEKLTVTVYIEDDEAFAIWADEIGVPTERIIRIGDNKGARYASDNFWQMADTGPCGPCSEIFYDHGPDVWGGPPGSPEENGDRFIEIWNLVFMQFNRDKDGVLTPLPKPCVDTGMGLERLAAVLQHVHSNYDIDLFQALIKAAARETGATDLTNNSLKVIADHIRAATFLIVDGVIPSADSHGYVLRRIIRRALRHGYKLGQSKPFFYKLAADLRAEMGEAYPELAEKSEAAQLVLKTEEERFGETLEKGMRVLETRLAGGAAILDGATAFTLYDTYGFPLDLTADICRERGVQLDEAGFADAMAAQRETARAAGKFKLNTRVQYSGAKTEFLGYTQLQVNSTVIALYRAGVAVDELSDGQEGIIVLDRTPFYAESGGQVGDTGILRNGTVELQVVDTQKIQPDVHGHHGILRGGPLRTGDPMTAVVDLDSRNRTARNHSATHLMHKALCEVLGGHVQQKGSLVDPDKTRFDFSHGAPVTSAELAQVELIVNREICANHETRAQHMSFEDALAQGATALFGEKYADTVRVLDIGPSRELCGGVHVARTGDIGFFKIASESGVAAGIRRIEAVTGEGALALVQSLDRALNTAAASLKTAPADVNARIHQVQEQTRALEREVASLKSKLAATQGVALASEALTISGVKVLSTEIHGADTETLRATLDHLKASMRPAVIVLASASADKVSLIAGVTDDLTTQLTAGELVNFVARQVGGKGGGRADMAQAGGTEPGNLPAALSSVADWVRQRAAA
jgi:alanyl-tRNA synthetase